MFSRLINKKSERRITPSSSYTSISELLDYKDLIYLLVKRDLLIIYKQTVLGPLWFMLQPLLTALVFSFVFGKIARISTGGIPFVLFYLSGLILWEYFNDSFQKIANSLNANKAIFEKVYFPRIIVPISILLSGLVKLFFQLIVLFSFLLFYSFDVFKINFFVNSVASICVSVFYMMLLALGTGLAVSSMTVKYKDATYFTGFALRLLMYGTPIIYPLSIVPPEYKKYIMLNPLTHLVTLFRESIFEMKFQISALGAIYISVITATTLAAGHYLFSRAEKNFVDTI